MKHNEKPDLKEAKQVMEDEGGATQAGMKKQKGKKVATDTYDQPGENAQANEPEQCDNSSAKKVTASPNCYIEGTVEEPEADVKRTNPPSGKSGK